jgi:N-acetyl-anhydromuramyl-L-alanine amidase AmpD
MEAGLRPRIAGGTTAIDCALRYYAASGTFAHYVIGYDGTIWATAPEERVAYHAGWSREQAAWAGWRAPAWWASVWGAARTPRELLPPRAAGPNSRSIGIELLGALRDSGFTDAQYRALGDLSADLERRYRLGLAAPPNVRLLGHEDLNPITRSNAGGGWDPGAHRRNPVFSWDRVWRELLAARGGAAREVAAG